MRQRSNSQQRTVREGAVVSSRSVKALEAHDPRFVFFGRGAPDPPHSAAANAMRGAKDPGRPVSHGGRDDVQALAVRLVLQTGGR